MIRLLLLFIVFATAYACSSASTQQETTFSSEPDYPTKGSVERLDSAINQIIPPGARPEILAEGFDWSEGPVWVPNGDYLLFSDVPTNSIYRWSETDSILLYLKPSGYTQGEFEGKEPGSNGLVLDASGHLVLCQHGERQVARMNAPLNNPQPNYTTLAGQYEGKRFNSPNDLVFHSNGDLYFTDPPYGLPDSSARELDFQGVYRLSAADSSLTLLTAELSRPNGIVLSPDEQTLYVANSDSKQALWMAYDVTEQGVENGRVFFDATDQTSQAPGLPDGMAMHSQGYLFATGPGGVWIFGPEGTHLGTILTGEATANCTLDDDESTLYITADGYLLRLKLKGNL